VPALLVQGGIAVVLVLFFSAGGAQATGSGD
jgi:hypothetical protein